VGGVQFAFEDVLLSADTTWRSQWYRCEDEVETGGTVATEKDGVDDGDRLQHDCRVYLLQQI
jgi:hypothetical protein